MSEVTQQQTAVAQPAPDAGVAPAADAVPAVAPAAGPAEAAPPAETPAQTVDSQARQPVADAAAAAVEMPDAEDAQADGIDAEEPEVNEKVQSAAKSLMAGMKSELDSNIRDELLREYCASHRETSIFVPLLAMVIPYVTSAWLPEWHFIVWSVVGTLFVGISWLAYTSFIKAKDDGRVNDENVKQWIIMIGAPRALFMTFLVGLVVWSIMAKTPNEFFMSYVFIMAVMSVNSASSGLYLPLMYAELLPMALLLAAGVLMPGLNPGASSWAGAMLIYTLFVTRMGMAVHASSRSMFEQKRDILTAKDAAEDARYAAEEANHAKSAFLATMSHEVRTPMNGILGMVNLLRDTNLDKQQRDFTETIHYSGEALLTILNDILDFSKLEAGKLDFEMMDFDMKRLLESVRSLMQSRASERGDIIELIAPEHLPRFLRSDPTRLRQVLLNLISNAVKFTENGVVTLDVEIMPSDDRRLWLRFNVRDTGIGIPEEARAKLFQKFSQVDSSISRRYGGTGLGLAICKQIVEQMNGQIGVESETNKGSNFWFEMPFAEARDIHLDEDDEIQVMRQDEVRMSPKHILLAEDNIVNQKVALGLLNKHGHHVTLVVNGREAVEAVQKQQYDLVLMDMQMPEMDGLEATKTIREMGGYYAELPIIALTANAMRGDDERCFAAGMNAHVGKPVNPIELYEIMAKLVEPSALNEPETTVIPQDLEGPGAAHVQQIEMPEEAPSHDVAAQPAAAVEPAAEAAPPPQQPAQAEAAPVEAAPVQAVPEQAVAEQPAPEQAVPEQAVPEQAVPEQAVPEQAVPEQAPQQPAAQEVAAQPAQPLEQPAPQPAAEQPAAEQPAAEQQPAPEQAAQEPVASAPEQPAPEQPAPEQPAPEQLAIEQPASGHVVPAEPVAEAQPTAEAQPVAEAQTVAEPEPDFPAAPAAEAAPAQVAPEQTMPEQPMPEQAAPEQAITEQSVAEQPVADQPVAHEPAVEPPAAELPVAELAPTQPETAPEGAVPEASQPIAAEPVAEPSRAVTSETPAEPIAEAPAEPAAEPVAETVPETVADAPSESAPVAAEPEQAVQEAGPAQPDQPATVAAEAALAEPEGPTVDAVPEVAQSAPVAEAPPAAPSVPTDQPAAITAQTGFAEPEDPTLEMDDAVAEQPSAETTAPVAEPAAPEAVQEAAPVEPAPVEPVSEQPVAEQPVAEAAPETPVVAETPAAPPVAEQPAPEQQPVAQAPAAEAQPEAVAAAPPVEQQAAPVAEAPPAPEQPQPQPEQPVAAAEPPAAPETPPAQPAEASNPPEKMNGSHVPEVVEQLTPEAPAQPESIAAAPEAAPETAPAEPAAQPIQAEVAPVAPPAAADPETLLGFDQSRVDQMEQSLGKEFMVGFLAESVPEIMKMLDNLDNASAGYYDAMTSRQIAHDLKALSGQLGMEGLHGYLERVEMCYAEERMDEANVMCAPVRETFVSGLNKLRDIYPAAFAELGENMQGKVAEAAGHA